MDPEPIEEMEALVGDLVQASRVPAKRRQFPVKPTVERLAALAYEHGLPPQVLRTLVVDVLTAPDILLDQASLGSLIRNLYPATAVDDEIALAVVGCLGHGQRKPPLPVQALLLRWLVLVYQVLSTAALAVLSRSYTVLFNLIDTDGIRPQLCHVLVLITRRKHVRPFRIQAVLGLARQIDYDPHLVGLLRVFKSYYPEVIVGDAARGRASPFKYPDPPWRIHLDSLRLAHQQNRLEGGRTNLGANGIDLVDDAPFNGFRVRQNRATEFGRSANSVLPSVHTAYAHEDSVTLEEIHSAADLVQYLETIELPSQMVAVLADPLLQKLLLLRPSDESFARVDRWLEACIASVASGHGKGKGTIDELMELLEVVHEYITSTQTFPPVFHRFYGEILAHWDGREKKHLILESLAFASDATFAGRFLFLFLHFFPSAVRSDSSDRLDTYKATFYPLEVRLLNNLAPSQMDLLSFYTLVLQQQAIRMTATEGGSDIDPGSVQAAAFIQALVQHVSDLVLALIQNTTNYSSSPISVAGGTSTRALLAVLDFYEEVTSVLSLRRDGVLACVQELIPPPTALYTMHFHPSPAVASRLYAVLANYKRGLESAIVHRPRRSAAAALASAQSDTVVLPQTELQPLALPLTDHERARVNLFNGYLMDVCNCLWRSRAFSSTDTNALGCLVDGAVAGRLANYVQGLLDHDLPLAAAFSLSHSPTLCLQAVSYLRQLEDDAVEVAAAEDYDNDRSSPPLQRRHAGPITQASLVRLAESGGLRLTWPSFRLGLLAYFEQQGFGGISSLMHNTIKNLMNARASSG
ncbi:hypothetical protein SEPCBS119000_000300 [Sporothrix epigloea]|uniref:Centromere protein I n=1 Tax=Sporothrix epigloea TaxID=1892477 RepID=A0ABP0D4D0_9PEZI